MARSGAYIFADTNFADNTLFIVASDGHTFKLPKASENACSECFVEIASGLTVSLTFQPGDSCIKMPALNSVTSISGPSSFGMSVYWMISNGGKWNLIQLA